jgi:hypothetical protein
MISDIFVKAAGGAALAVLACGIAVAAPIPTPVDLTLFYRSTTVELPVLDAANFNSDPDGFPVLLSDRPNLGDTEIFTSGPGAELRFDWRVLDATGIARFVVSVYDMSAVDQDAPISTLLLHDDGPMLLAASAVVSLSLPPAGHLLGVEFEFLPCNDNGSCEGSGELRGVSFVVPEPATATLVVAGFLITIPFWRRRQT